MMLDYYQILGIPRFSDLSRVRSAFRQLAFKYHPDKNPGNKAAEEYFKQINEAHQVLINPQKKSQYDLILNYAHQLSPTQNTRRNEAPFSNARPYEAYKRQWQERSVYNRYGTFDWRNPPQFKKASRYRIDKDYFKIQALTLLGVFLLSLVILGSVKVNHYFEEQEAATIRIKNNLIINQAHQLYAKGKYRSAIDMVTALINKYPIENQFSNEKEKMVAGINNEALSAYKGKDYQHALSSLEVVRDYERPMRLSTWRMVAECYYELGQYKKAIHALDYIFIREKSNIELAIRIGDIYNENLGRTDKALEYYTHAKYIFKATYSATYGEAFELIMSAERTPQIYFTMFYQRGELNMKNENFEEAITDFNWAIYLRPQEQGPYHLRGICHQETGAISRACRDWQNAIALGFQQDKALVRKFCSTETD